MSSEEDNDPLPLFPPDDIDNHHEFPTEADETDDHTINLGELGDGDTSHGHLFDLNQEPDNSETEPNMEPNNGESNANLEPNIPVETEGGTHGQFHHNSSRRRLSSDERLQILMWLLQRIREGKLQRGSINAAAEHFSVSRKSIGSIWKTAKAQKEANIRFNVNTRYHNSGRKRVHVLVEAITALHMGDRSCIRDLACKLSISKTTVGRMIKRGEIKAHSNPLHPGLKPEHKLVRLRWILGLLQGNSPEQKSTYYGMFDFVHIDEKWFYLSKKSHKVYLASTEKGPYRAACNSKWIPKVMFMAVVARPRFNSEGECVFDGKIGIFPFTYQEAAKRKSHNRPRGTILTKCMESVNQKVTRHMLMHDICPAIMAKWPATEGHKVIFIQQDNARAHILQDDAEWQAFYQQDGFTFVLIKQPANSPDLNILDLGFFRSIQSLMHKKMPKDIDAMMAAVNDAFYELEAKTLGNVWMTLQYVMNEVLKCNGGNHYDLPHVNKKRLEVQGGLALQVKAPAWAVNYAWDICQGIIQLPNNDTMQQQENGTQQEDSVDM